MRYSTIDTALANWYSSHAGRVGEPEGPLFQRVAAFPSKAKAGPNVASQKLEALAVPPVQRSVPLAVLAIWSVATEAEAPLWTAEMFRRQRESAAVANV